MTWDAISAAADLLGAVGVVASLLYVSLQIRQNTQALRSATFQNIIGFAAGFAEGMAREPDLARIFSAGLDDTEPLRPDERVRFHFQMISLLRRYENTHYQTRMRALDDEEWEGLRASLDTMLFRPGARRWWAENGRLFNASFRAFIERRFADAQSRETQGEAPLQGDSGAAGQGR